MNDQLQDIEQEQMFKRNERKFDRLYWLFAITWIAISGVIFWIVMYVGVALIILAQPATALYGQHLIKKYPFRTQHLKP